MGIPRSMKNIEGKRFTRVARVHQAGFPHQGLPILFPSFPSPWSLIAGPVHLKPDVVAEEWQVAFAGSRPRGRLLDDADA